MRSVLSLLAVALVTAASVPAAAAVTRDGWDQQEVNAMSLHAVELLETGEARGAAGDLAEAAALFKEAELAAPMSTLLRRRECEALTALGRRAEAIDACTRATEDKQTGTNLRALVRSLLDGPTAPGTIQLFQALSIMGLERYRSPGGVTPAAISCDIAATIGDGAMLQHCADELGRIAPDDVEARRASTLLASRCPPWRFWTGWLAIVAVVLLTIADTIRRSASGRHGRKAAAALAAVGVILLAVQGSALAEGPPEAPHGALSNPRGALSKWKIDDEQPDRDIPDEKARNADPLEFGYWLQDLALKGEQASARGDHAAAVKFYVTMAKAVPDSAVSYVKACEEYEALGDITNAIDTCGGALTQDGVKVGDYTHFVHLVLSRPGPLGDKQAAAVTNVIKHMKENPDARNAADDLECEVGVRTSNVVQLRECTAALAARAPDDPKTVTYEWALAIQEGRFDQARKLIERAGSLGVPIDAMKQTTVSSEKRYWLRLLVALVGLAMLVGGGSVVARALTRRTLTPKPG
jgi:tetratricopeptide (TPR) repeat protein